MTLKRLLLSRSTVLALIATLTALMVVASLVPQSFTTPAAELARWRAEHPALAAAAAALGLHHVYTHPVFAALLSLTLLALGHSTVDQLRTALTRPRSAGAGVGAVTVELPAEVDAVARALRSKGYVTVRRGDAERLLVRHPWGHWGNFLLHAGLLVAFAASAVIGLTQQRGVVHLVEGETFGSGGPWFAEQNGVAATRLVLPFSVRLEHLEYRFSEAGALERVTSTLTLVRRGQDEETLKVGINDLQRVDGLTIYQGVELGHAFRVAVEGGETSDVLTLLVEHPSSPGAPGANEFRVLAPGELLRAKYFVSSDGGSFDAFNPLLVLRVDGPGGSLGEVSLRPGTSGTVGPYRFRLEKVSLWTRLFFANVSGIPGVFAGFFIIALGGVLHYFTPPREAALVASAGGGTRMTWRAPRFGSFYAEELDAIRSAVSSRGSRG